MALHSWDLPAVGDPNWDLPEACPPACQLAPECPPTPTPHDWLDAEDAGDPENAIIEDAGEMLFDLLVDIKLAGTLSATRVCVLAFWAARAGAKGKV